jgi:hypothetical protein
MNIAQAKCIPLESYLSHQGIKPQKSRHGGRELWYHSPIRKGDEHPSFKIDTEKNLWFDHGIATGGNIINLVREICACDVRDALRHLEKTGLYTGTHTPNKSIPTAVITRHNDQQQLQSFQQIKKSEGEKEKISAFELVRETPLNHPALLQYLSTRGIDHDVAREYIAQIHFKPSERDKTYFSLGYPSGNGFEARSANFKGFIGTEKSVTFHDKENTSCLQIFEGFMDFLSYLSKDKPTQPIGAVLVLNSTNLWKRALPYINNPKFQEVRLYLDNDTAGEATTQKLFENADNSTKIADMRSYYQGFEDLNAWFIDQKS